MAGIVSGCVASQQRAILQGSASRSGIRKRRRASGLADRRICRSIQVSIVVVWRVGRSARRRQATSGSRKISLRAESPYRPVLAGAVGESVRQVSLFFNRIRR